jgi:chorismate mutase
MNFTSGAPVSELLSLDLIREQLIRLEDTIIFRQYHLLGVAFRLIWIVPANLEYSLD